MRHHDVMVIMKIDTFANRPDAVQAAVDIAWDEWGSKLSPAEYQRWLDIAQADSRSHSTTSAGFVVFLGVVPVGAVQVHEFDIPDLHDRSPWVCGMVVKAEHRGCGLGGKLLEALEAFVADGGVDRLWVYTEEARTFYERNDWTAVMDRVSDTQRGTVLSKRIARD